MNSYLVLLRVGFTLPFSVARNAVRSYRTLSPLPQKNCGGLLSAALAVGFRRPDVIWHSALWSPDFPLCKPFTAYKAIAQLTCPYILPFI